MCSPTKDQANFNGVLCLLIFLFNGIYPKTLQTKNDIFIKICPSTGQKKYVNFKILLIFNICRLCRLTILKIHMDDLGYTDLLVTALQVCEKSTYLSCTKQQLYSILYTVLYTVLYTLLYNRLCLGAQISG